MAIPIKNKEAIVHMRESCAIAAGVLHQWHRGRPIGPALEFGLAAAALKHSVPGDVNRVSEAEVTACMDRTSAAFIRR